jgi:hypothetical protein
MSTSRTADRRPRHQTTHEQAEDIVNVAFDWIMAPIDAVADAFFRLCLGPHRYPWARGHR